ncbi:MAG: WbqC family protein [Thaumarchaeota archaeon]|nr:WbqC family protein [Nitrososphaerota archaeon]
MKCVIIRTDFEVKTSSIRVASTQPTYIPWMGFFGLMDCVDRFVLMDDVQFSRRSWHQRNRVFNPASGWIWLTIPTKGEFPTPMNKVKVDGRSWIRSHLDRLKALYSAAPYFDDVRLLFDNLRSIESEFLTDYTIGMIQQIRSLLGIETPLYYSSKISHEFKHKTELLICLTQSVGGGTYVAQPTSVEEYIEKDLFPSSGIRLELFEYNHPQYRDENFVSHQSILDMISYVPPSNRLAMIRSGVQIKPL